MKSIQIILSVAILLVTLSGCENQKMQTNDGQTVSNATVAESTTDNRDNTTKTTTDNNSSQNTTKENNQDQKSFYGNWEITKVAGYAKVSTGEKESLIGLKISFSNNLATFGNESYNNPHYKITNRTQENMASEYNTNLSKIGVNAESISELDVPNKMTLFIKDNDTLLYFDEGVYYETKRVS